MHWQWKPQATTTTKYSNWLHVGSLRKYKLTSTSRKVYTAAESEVIICYIWTKFNLCLFHWFANITPHTISFGIRGYHMLHLNKFNLCLFHWFANNTPHTISFGIRGYYMLHLNKFNLCLFHWFADITPHTISFFL